MSDGCAPLKTADLKVRRPIHHPDLPFVVLWSQKAACTAVVRWCFFQLGVLDEALRHDRFVHKWERQVFKRRPGYLADCRQALVEGKPAIKFVRDPAARAFSSYVGAVGPQSIRLQGSWFQKTRAQVVAVERLAAAAAPYTFAQFLDAIECLGHAAFDLHVAEQVVGYEALLAPEIVRVETLPDALDRLAEKYGLKPLALAPPDLLESFHHRPKKLDLRGGELAELLARPIDFSARQAIDLPMVDTARLSGTALGERVEQVFARDYAAYGYRREA